MGIYITLDIIPAKIKSQEWLKVYEECLMLVDAYPFMSGYVDKTKYRCKWTYVDKPKEKPIGHKDRHLGIEIIGDLNTMQSAEVFYLFRDFDVYRFNKESKYGDESEHSTDDVLFLLVHSLFGEDEDSNKEQLEILQ